MRGPNLLARFGDQTGVGSADLLRDPDTRDLRKDPDYAATNVDFWPVLFFCMQTVVTP